MFHLRGTSRKGLVTGGGNRLGACFPSQASCPRDGLLRGKPRREKALPATGGGRRGRGAGGEEERERHQSGKGGGTSGKGGGERPSRASARGGGEGGARGERQPGAGPPSRDAVQRLRGARSPDTHPLHAAHLMRSRTSCFGWRGFTHVMCGLQSVRTPCLSQLCLNFICQKLVRPRGHRSGRRHRTRRCPLLLSMQGKQVDRQVWKAGGQCGWSGRVASLRLGSSRPYAPGRRAHETYARRPFGSPQCDAISCAWRHSVKRGNRAQDMLGISWGSGRETPDHLGKARSQAPRGAFSPRGWSCRRDPAHHPHSAGRDHAGLRLCVAPRALLRGVQAQGSREHAHSWARSVQAGKRPRAGSRARRLGAQAGRVQGEGAIVITRAIIRGTRYVPQRPSEHMRIALRIYPHSSPQNKTCTRHPISPAPCRRRGGRTSCNHRLAGCH